MRAPQMGAAWIWGWQAVGQDGSRGRAGRGRRWLKRLLWVPVWLVVVSIAQVASLRVIDPPFSAFMAWRQLDAMRAGDWDFRIAYDWRDASQMSPHVPVALVAAEDQRFAEHSGFDLEAIEKARKSNARGKRLRGGSTISQQTAKNLFLWSGGGYLRKGIEAWYTLLIEAMWPKRRILEVYANVAEFGDGVYGAQAAARTYFRRDAGRLDASQAARLAAVLPRPKLYSVARPGPYVQRRTRGIERQMRGIGGTSYLRTLD